MGEVVKNMGYLVNDGKSPFIRGKSKVCKSTIENHHLQQFAIENHHF